MMSRESMILKRAFLLYKASKEKLCGGKGDNQPDSKYISSELKKGISHELEHIKNKSIAKEISKDHLEENPKYYSLLDKAKID